MKIQEILQHASRPEIYDKGNAIMWTDPYISQQLLDVHLNLVHALGIVMKA